jgi:hypothetical protein
MSILREEMQVKNVKSNRVRLIEIYPTQGYENIIVPGGTFA